MAIPSSGDGNEDDVVDPTGVAKDPTDADAEALAIPSAQEPLPEGD